MLRTNYVIISGKVSSKKVVDDKARMRIKYEMATKKFDVIVEGEKESIVAFEKGQNVLIEGSLFYEKVNEKPHVFVLAKKMIVVGDNVNFNTVIISGNMTYDPEVLPVTKGENSYTVSKIKLVNNSQKKPLYFVIESWNNLAKTTEKFKKGSTISVSGSLILKTWGDKESLTMVQASTIDFVK